MIISSDGLLNLLPFGALYFDNRYLIQQSNILYIPCAKDFVSSFFKYNSNSSKAKEIVVFGNPDYDKSFKASNTRGGYKLGYRMIDLKSYFHTLQGTIKEISFLKKQYKNAIIYQDKNATVENLLSIVNPIILHIATHGFYIPNSSSNHLQETGLALAGANKARRTTDTRGLVTALKISTMELFKTKLVVLSACQTGVGKIELSEGISGLSKSFIQAGAKNVMMSLWNVDDKETANLMKKFYKNIQKNKTFTQSLREAKLSMIHLHPYYWSSFIISGI
jgi:CHAT domain-containing protein